MYLLLAWRNIWRNPRRTLVIMTAVVIGVWSMILMAAIMRGMEKEMVRNGIATLTGSIQIRNENYKNDPVVENSMADTPIFDSGMKECLPEGSFWAKRIRVDAVATNARHSCGVTLVGVEPEKEVKTSFLGQSITSGRFLEASDKNKIVVGRALLEKFNTKMGNKLILMSQDTGKEISSRTFRIVGVFRAEMKSIEKKYVFVPISQAAKMLKLENAISEVSILLPELDIDGEKEAYLAEKIEKKLAKTGYCVETWRDSLPMLKTYLDMSDFFLYVWFVVVFIAMGFGIVNTSLMAIFERMREFGLMKALGMRGSQIVIGVVVETLFLLVMGISLGMVLGFLSVAVISKKGIDLSSLSAGAEMWGVPRVLYPEIWAVDAVGAGLVVLVLGLLVSLYPALKAAAFTPVEAMAKH